jgi:hypothetical protein
LSAPSFSLDLPVRGPSPKAIPSKRAEPGITESLVLPPILPPVGWGERDRDPNVGGFDVAICSKCERSEDTGFWGTFCQRDKIAQVGDGITYYGGAI